MIKRSLTSLPWGRICVLSVVVGLLSMVSLSLSIFLALYAGILISIWIWFASRPFQWWYDILFFASLLCASLLSSVVFMMGCQILDSFSLSSNACKSTNFTIFAPTMTLTMSAPGMVFWSITYIRIFFGGK